VKAWYEDLAASLVHGGEQREPLPHDRAADGRLLEAVRRDLRDRDGRASATAVRMIWTGDHVVGARGRRLVFVGPARAPAER
jgi:hypothetical protein